MATPVLKHSNEALALITLYNAMTSEVKKEVKEMIVKETEDEETDMFTDLSFQSWDAKDDNIEEESAIWEKFYKELKNV